MKVYSVYLCVMLFSYLFSLYTVGVGRCLHKQLLNDDICVEF